MDCSLASVGIFRNLDPAILRRLEAELQWLTLDAGDTLVRQGASGDSLFIVMSGRLGVFAEGSDGEEVVGEIGKGEVVGEVAFIADLPYAATVLALRSSVLAQLMRPSLQRIQSEYPALTAHIMRTLAERLHSPASRNKTVDRGSTIALVVVSREPHVRDVAARFVASLGTCDTTLHLNQDRVTATFQSDSAAVENDFLFTEWLARCESGVHFVICETDATPSTWTERSLHHADRVLLLVDAGDTAESVGRQLRAIGVDRCLTRRELVLVRRSTDAPQTAAWRGILPVSEIHHVRAGEGGDVDRLARIVAGRAVGLVLGGGGARGLAHIGVVRALREAGVPIDYVGGASMGAVIAGEVALGWTPQFMLQRSKEEFRVNPVRGDYTLPMVAVSTATKLVRMLKGLFGNARIEDQIVGYFCVSCNLTRGEIVVHRDGMFRDCTRASSGLPGFWPPVFRNGELLVDGSIINNTPGDVMKTICGGRVIVVDVSPRRELRAELTDRYVLSGWEALRSRPRAASRASHPNIFNIVMRAAMLNSVLDADRMKRQVDLYLQPPVAHVDMFNWGAIDSIAELGYRYTIEQLDSGTFAPDGSS